MYNVLVTAIGSIIGYGILKSLKNSKYATVAIGMDIYSDVVGRGICDKFVQGIPATDNEYIEFMKKIIEEYNIDMVMFGTEEELERVIDKIEEFKKLNVKLVLNNISNINILNNKWIMYNALKENKIQAIESYIEGEFNEIKARIGVPMLVKPRVSYASKGIVAITEEYEFVFWKKKLGENFMVQQIVGNGDNEYTVSIFGLGDGTYVNRIILRRQLGFGTTIKAWVEELEEMNNYIDELVSIFKPIGPTNLQFRKHGNVYLLLEINPRISASTSIREKFGYNEAEMCVEYFLQNKIPDKREIKKGHAVRYMEDFITYDSNH